MGAVFFHIRLWSRSQSAFRHLQLSFLPPHPDVTFAPNMTKIVLKLFSSIVFARFKQTGFSL